MEMCCVPRREIERLIRRGGGEILAGIEHDSCGAEYENYQYFVRKRRRPPLLRRFARSLARYARSIVSRSIE